MINHLYKIFDSVRDDGYCEMSITWGDDKEAFETIMSQISPRTNTYQFQGGACEISREDLHVCMKAHFIAKRLCYERKATINNKYHGNILMKNDIDKQMQKLIRFGLATIAGENIKPNPNVR